MKKINIEISDNNLETVLLILQNLKEGLILNIETEKKNIKASTSYKPKENKVIYEDEQMTGKLSGKYANPATYKNRLKNK